MKRLAEQHRKRKAGAAALAVGLLASLWGTAQAATLQDLPAGPTKSYILIEGRDALPSPVGYVADQVLDGVVLPSGGWKTPQDLFVDKEGMLFLADTGNNRVLKMKPNGDLLLTIGGDGADGPAALNGPQGVFVWGDGTIFVADTGNNRVAWFRPDGSYMGEVKNLSSPVLEADFNFQPTKIVVDERGMMFIINGGDYRGLMTIDQRGRFRGWSAANRVGFNVNRLFIRFLASEAQKEQITKLLPPPHSNMFLDKRGFIYTVSAFSLRAQIKKLNGTGINTFAERQYGELVRRGWQFTLPKFQDLTVDDQGIVTAIDANSGKVYQYDQEGNQLVIFGGIGDQKGLFRYPSSIEHDKNGLLYIVDSQRNTIQVFRPTEFAQLVHLASRLYYEGRYEESIEPWKQVLLLNANYRLAHRGLGKAGYKQEKWQEAMHEFRLTKGGLGKGGYSDAFGELRHEYMRKNFGIVVLGFVIVVAVAALILRGAQEIVRRDRAARGGF